MCFRFRKARRFSLLILKSIKNKLLIKPGLRPNGIEVIKILNLIKSIHLSFFLNKKKTNKNYKYKAIKTFHDWNLCALFLNISDFLYEFYFSIDPWMLNALLSTATSNCRVTSYSLGRRTFSITNKAGWSFCFISAKKIISIIQLSTIKLSLKGEASPGILMYYLLIIIVISLSINDLIKTKLI